MRMEEGIYKLTSGAQNLRFITIRGPHCLVNLYLDLEWGVIEPMNDWPRYSFIKTNETLSIGISDEK